MEGGTHKSLERYFTISQDIELAEQDLDPKKEKLRQNVIVLRILIYLLMVITILAISALFPSTWYVVISGLVLIAIAFLGLRATFREEIMFLDLFWKGLYFWSGIFSIVFILYLIFPSWGIETTATERCSSRSFVIEGYNPPGGTCEGDGYKSCYETCLAEVQRSLIIEICGLVAFIDAILISLASRARGLAVSLAKDEYVTGATLDHALDAIERDRMTNRSSSLDTSMEDSDEDDKGKAGLFGSTAFAGDEEEKKSCAPGKQYKATIADPPAKAIKGD